MKYLDQIALGDCFKLIKEIPNNSIDLIVTSPPYNIGKEYENKRPLHAYLQAQSLLVSEAARILKDSGSIFWQVGSFIDKGTHIPLDVKLFPIFEDNGFIPRNRIVWIRSHGLHAKNRYSCRHETILWFTKSDNYKFNLDSIRVPQKYANKKGYRGKNKGKLTCNPEGKNPGDVWAFRNVKHNHEEQTIHPCQFPEDMVERIILSTTDNGDVVFDPYMGCGTTAVAAKNLDRHFVGFEIDKDYHSTAIGRLNGQPDKNDNFPNLKTLRNFVDEHMLGPNQFSFTKQIGKVATTKDKAKIFPERHHLEEQINRFVFESEAASSLNTN